MRTCTLSLVFLAACGPQVDGGLDTLEESGAALAVSGADGALVLALVNYPGTTVETLDLRAGIDRRAATNIIARRDGADRTALTADDAPFESIAALDAVAYVGDAALQKLIADAKAHPAPAAELVEGVAFAGWESESVVWGVNQAAPATLDGLLDRRAAQGLVGSRPFASVTQMGPVAYVGASALDRLKREARAWWTAQHAPAPAACTLAFEPKAVAQESDYAARIEALDTRSAQYHFVRAAFSVPSCFDPAKPEHVDALQKKVLDAAGLGYVLPQFANQVTFSFQAGPARYDDLLQISLDYMNELNFDAVDAGDLQKKAELDALWQSHQAMRALTSASSGSTWSLRVYLEASECSQLAGAFVDLKTGTLLVLLRPAMC